MIGASIIMNKGLKVLDHGLVKLVSHMQPSYPDEVPNWTPDMEPVRNARVSYDASRETGQDLEADHKLLNFLIKNYHTSPLEAMVFTFEIKAPIFVIRQWHRHRTWSYSEVSARYKELPEVFYIPELKHVGVQSKSNKQMRDLEEAAGLSQEAAKYIADLQLHSSNGFRFYQEHLKAGIPRELSRLFLGFNTYTHMFATGDSHNLMHFLKLRLHEHAQYEIQMFARALLHIVVDLMPVTFNAFIKHRLGE